jgi:hypothetical protein
MNANRPAENTKQRISSLKKEITLSQLLNFNYSIEQSLISNPTFDPNYVPESQQVDNSVVEISNFEM